MYRTNKSAKLGFGLCKMFVRQARIVKLRTPWLHTSRLVLQYAICLPKWVIIQHFNTQQTSIAAKACEGEGEEEAKKKEKWSKVEWCQLLCHLSKSWLHSWYVETTFLKSGGDNPRLFPFARPPIAVLVLPAQSEFRVGFVVVIDGWPIPLFALIVAALLWAKWQHLKFEFYMVFLTSWKVPKWDISKSCFINSKELST